MRLATFVCLAGATLLLGLPVPSQSQEDAGKRVALVVGNAHYRAVPGLGNTANDARLLARTLIAKGFTLVGGDARIDLDRAGFNAALDAFARALPGADVGLFYYAGHGLEVQGANWLVPVDAAPRRGADLDAQMINAVRVLNAMRAGGTKLNLVILDACRDNPVPDLQTPGGETGLSSIQGSGSAAGRGLGARGGGLAQMQAPEGTVIAFATQPGSVALDGTGGDSPFALALEQALQEPGVDVLALFNQVGVSVKHATGGQQQPWISSSPIEGAFFLGEQPLAPLPDMQAAGSMPPASPAAAALLAKVRAKAAPHGIPVPQSLTIRRPDPDVPPPLAQFAGVWGPGRWASRNGYNDFILVVSDIDRTGQAQLLLLNSAGCVDSDCTVRSPFIGHIAGAVQDGRLTYRSQRTGQEFAFWPVNDGALSASHPNMRGTRLMITNLQRIE
jgi:uncharacterized caspase-like protein